MAQRQPIPSDPMFPAELAVDDEPFTDDELDRYYAVMATTPGDGTSEADDEAGAVQHVHGWQVTDNDTAEWAMAKLALARDEVAALADQRDAWMARISHWFDQAAAKHQGTVAYMTGRLEDYGVRVRAADPKRATIPLPSGKVATTKSEPTAVVADDQVLYDAFVALDGDDLVKWSTAMTNAKVTSEDLLKLEPKVYVGPLRKLVTVDEVLTGRRYDVTLACGHEVSWHQSAHDGWGLGDLRACEQCPTDALDGAPPLLAIVELGVVDVSELVVHGPDGKPVPGVVVRPGSITPKVTPGA